MIDPTSYSQTWTTLPNYAGGTWVELDVVFGPFRRSFTRLVSGEWQLARTVRMLTQWRDEWLVRRTDYLARELVRAADSMEGT